MRGRWAGRRVACAASSCGKDDFVVSVCAVSAEEKEQMLSVSEKGFGKQTPITSYRLKARGGKGVINMKTTAKTGKVVAVFPVEEDARS